MFVVNLLIDLSAWLHVLICYLSFRTLLNRMVCNLLFLLPLLLLLFLVLCVISAAMHWNLFKMVINYHTPATWWWYLVTMFLAVVVFLSHFAGAAAADIGDVTVLLLAFARVNSMQSLKIIFHRINFNTDNMFFNMYHLDGFSRLSNFHCSTLSLFLFHLISFSCFSFHIACSFRPPNEVTIDYNIQWCVLEYLQCYQWRW